LPDASEAAALRNRVLSGDYDRRASAALGVAASADRTAFAEAYEAARCGSGETLTPHQREALEACAAGVDVHLKAPAGSGKTLWALHRLVNELQGDAGLAVFVARNKALACAEFDRWFGWS
jgi:replicative superfamily II helicase